MSRCRRCETLPEPLPESGVLYIAPPVAETENAMRQYFLDSGYAVCEAYPGILAVDYPQGSLRVFCDRYFSDLSSLELDDTRVLLCAPGEAPSVSQLVRMQSLSRLVATIQGEWLSDVLCRNSLETHFQPIVDCQNPALVHGHEGLLRGRDSSGSLIPPNRLLDTARAADLLFHLDRQARLTTIESACRQVLSDKIFINFNPTAIYNPDFCLKSTMAAIEAAGIARDRVVFEVVESDHIRDVQHLVNILAFYRRNGFKVALDDLGSGFSSLNLLAQVRPDYMKLDMELVQGVGHDEYKSHITAALLEMAQRLGVLSIAEGVETVDEWHWLMVHGANFAQGYLFAKPAAKPLLPVVPGG